MQLTSGESYSLVYATAQLMAHVTGQSQARAYAMIRSYALFTAA